ncbi:MAG: DUF4965 domain-containing protein, partial [Armatimonadota bacterium]
MVELVLAMTQFGVQSRVPAFPLVTHSPYFSSWLMGDQLNGNWAKHWSGNIQAISGYIKIDGKAYRFCGNGGRTEELPQVGTEVTATTSTFKFSKDGVAFDINFVSPLLPKNLEVSTRPASYLNTSTKSIDGKKHDVSLYMDFTAEWCVGNESQPVIASRSKLGDLEALSFRSTDQPTLKRTGDAIPIDWGTFWAAGSKDEGWSSTISAHNTSRSAFVNGVSLDEDDLRFPRAANDDYPVLAFQTKFSVGDSAEDRNLIVAYDEDYAIEYFKRPLRPYWNRNEIGMGALLKKANAERDSIFKACDKFDKELAEKLSAISPEYKTIGLLAYRQCFAGHGFVQDLNGDILGFSKENTSNGCIGTVDVLFPAAPYYLYFDPEMLKAQLIPLLDYGSSSRWKFDFAPHDLGQYPKANGQVYGGGERTEENQMPVEESANLLILTLAYQRATGDKTFALKYAGTLKKWANYLERKGFDPENQLCTDDFAGHLAHNTNLSLKAIIAIRAFGELSGDQKFTKLAEQWAKDWVKVADDGDHFRLTFDKASTWSLKYNLLWDELLGFGLFPRAVVDKELNYYIKVQNQYGVPLDSRVAYTKTDWLMWAAALGDQKQFDVLTKP